ncbi:recombinase family protein [Sphingomonas sp.]|uniref:recombinase family protein n=1 Tax=Sphingomonas sp. TaxID=28214 RepID=UPI0025EEAEA2|nr:recombinase family protein [Sphingomonas sp.]MBV9529086.1 recombinase family protein [Sphingomonas sp.]
MRKETTPASVGTRAVLYLRVSTGRQAEHDLSIPDQRRQATSYCQGKSLQVVGEYVEPGASATDDRRPEFQRMMDAAAARPAEFDTIIVHSFSRFFRDQFQLEFYVRRLAKSGVRLVSITQDLGDDPMSVMMRQIMALFDEYQSKENAKHTLRAMRENARQGFWNGSLPPYGYRIVAAEQRGTRTKKKIEPDPDQAATVRLIFRLALLGDEERGPMGTRRIADYLNVRGLRTQTGGRWGLGAIHVILTRTTYIGKHRFNEYSWRTKTLKPEEEVVEVDVPAIIDPDEFAAVQVMLKERSPQLKAPRFVSSGTLLGGIAFCADCGGAMTLRSCGKSERYRYYTCCTRARQGARGCRGTTVSMDALNDIVVEAIEGRVLDPVHLEALLAGIFARRAARASQERDRIADLRRQAADADAKLTRLYGAIEAGVADLADVNLKGRMVELRAIRDATRADADRAEASQGVGRDVLTPEIVSRFAEEARRRLRAPSGSLHRHYIQAVAQRVEVSRSAVRVTGSKATLLGALARSGQSHPGVFNRANGVRAFEPKWLPGTDSNHRPTG